MEGRTRTPVLPGRASRVLIVDDDPIIRKLIAAVAKAVGCTTSEVADGRDALTMIEENDFDLVILDLMLPTLSGHDVLDRLDPDLGCSVIVVTASGDHDVEQLDSSLICDIVRKPFDVHDLAAVIRRGLGQEAPENGLGSGERLSVRRPDKQLKNRPSHPEVPDVEESSVEEVPSAAKADEDA